MELNQAFIASVLSDVVFVGKPLPMELTWVVDSRIVQSSDMFVALPGLNVDGHEFVESALAAGACGCLIASDKQDELVSVIAKYKHAKTFIIVSSPLSALLELAKQWRRQFNYPVIGITGSVGKTSTKALLANVLQLHNMQYIVAQGNQNTRIGIALNMLRMKAQHQVAVFELGISKRGEMAQLTELVQPTIAVITAIGHSHMEGLGSIADIAAEKRDIFKCLKEDGIGIIDGDQPLLSAVSYTHPIIRFGKKMINQVQARKIQVNQNIVKFQLKLYNERFAITLETENPARIYNVLAAATVAYVLNIPMNTIVQGVQQQIPVTGRFKKHIIAATKSIVIDDSYNASPESMKAALLAFERLEGAGKKVAVLGDMLELGINAPFWHRQLGRFLRKVPSLEKVIFVGEKVKWAQKMVPFGLEFCIVPTWRDALAVIKPQIETNMMVLLVKGSHGVGLHYLVDALTEQP